MAANNWRNRAACYGLNPTEWDNETEAARAVCINTCPVRSECLADALLILPRGGVGVEGGMRGGLTEGERRKLLRAGYRRTGPQRADLIGAIL